MEQGDDVLKNIRWIGKYVVKFRLGFSIGFLFLLLSIVAGVVVTGLQKVVIDDVFYEGQYDKLPTILLWFAAAMIGSNLFSVLWTHIGRVNAYKIYAMLTQDVMNAIHRTPAKVFHNERIARYMSCFTNDINWTTVAFTQFVPNGISNVIKVIILSVIIGWSSPVLLVSILLFSTLYMMLGKKFGKRVHLVSKQLQEARANFMVHLEEGVSSTREVVAFHRGEWEQAKVNENFRLLYGKVMLENRKLFWSDPLKWGGILIVLGYGGYLVWQGALSIGMYVVIYQYTFSFRYSDTDGSPVHCVSGPVFVSGHRVQ